MKWLLSFVSAVLFSLMLTGGVRAREEIRNYQVDIEVRTDASIEVTETITVNAEGNDIRRGIYRDIPLRALDDWGLWSSNGFDLVEVLHNGQPSPYHTEWQGRFFRILIGDADVFIPRGEHTYTIRYVTTRQLRFFEGYDELYWNVTGNFWSFPILKAEARVYLPDGARAIRDQVIAYTGPFGATGGNYTGSIIGGGSEVRFALTRPLGPEEGMTIAVGFTEGVVTRDDGTSFAGCHRQHRDLPADPGLAGCPRLFPLRLEQGRPRSAVAAGHPAVPSAGEALAGCTFLRPFQRLPLRQERYRPAVHRSVALARGEALPADRRGFARNSDAAARRGGWFARFAGAAERGRGALFDTSRQSRGDHPRQAQRSGPEECRDEAADGHIPRICGRYYNANIGWFIPGVLLAIASFIIGLILQDPPEEGILYLIPVLMTSLFGGGMWIAGRSLFGEGGTGNRIMGGILFVLGAAVFLIGIIVVLAPSDLPIYRLAGALVIIGCVVMISMVWLIGAPTAVGAKVLTDIKGFKLYLETAETNRLNMRDAPEMSEELFERFLPYAAGLGVEKPWSEAWAAHLARIAPEREK
jgi:hypothetical protein